MYIFLKLNKIIIIIIIIIVILCFSLGRKVCLQVFRYNENFPTWFQGKYSSNFFFHLQLLKGAISRYFAMNLFKNAKTLSMKFQRFWCSFVIWD